MKQVVVTGGTSGIGKGVAKYFAEQGYAVVIVGMRDDGESVAHELGEHVTYAKVDVTNEEQVRQLFVGLENVDALVNAAGIFIGNDGQGIDTVNPADYEQEWRVNTLGTLIVCKHAIKLLEQTKGNIVNISSISGMLAAKDSLGYNASKAAVDMLTKDLALMYAKRGVRVNAVCPGPIDTPMLRDGFDGKLEGNPEYDEWISHCPLKRCGQVDDVVRGVAYLSDPENTYLTGVLLPIDGGYTAKAL